MINEIISLFNSTTDITLKRHLAHAARRAVYLDTANVFAPKRHPNDPTNEEVELGLTQGKITMIKAHRNRTGLGLKESKDICEKWFEDHNRSFYRYSL